MSRTIKSLVACAVLAPAMAGAADFDYTYLDASFVQQDLDDVNMDGDGFGIRAGLALDRRWHMFADYTKTNLDPGNVDVESLLAGFGYSHVLSDKIDLVGNVGWAKAKVGTLDDDGWGAQALVRAKMTEQFHLEGGVQYVDLGSGGMDSDTAFRLGARYYFTDMISIGISGQKGEDDTQYGLNFRISLKDNWDGE